MVAFNLPSISSRTSKNPLKSQNPLSKEIDEINIYSNPKLQQE